MVLQRSILSLQIPWNTSVDDPTCVDSPNGSSLDLSCHTVNCWSASQGQWLLAISLARSSHTRDWLQGLMCNHCRWDQIDAVITKPTTGSIVVPPFLCVVGRGPPSGSRPVIRPLINSTVALCNDWIAIRLTVLLVA